GATQRRPVPYATFDEGHLAGDRRAVTATQVVEHDDLGAGLDQLLDYDTSDVPCAAGDEDAPRHSPRSRWKSLRSASTSKYPSPASASRLSASVGSWRNLLSRLSLNRVSRSRSSGCRCCRCLKTRSSSAARTASMRPRNSLRTGTIARVSCQAQKFTTSSSTICSARGISARRSTDACPATACRSSRSYRNTFSSCPTAGSTSRG